MSGPTNYDSSGLEMFTEQRPAVVQIADLLEFINEMRDLYNETQQALTEARSYHYFKSIDEYGAKGDGVTDNTVFLQNAFNDMTDGSVLFIPEGNYKYSGDITLLNKKNISIIGTGSKTSLLICDGVNKSIIFDSISYITLGGFAIVGNGIGLTGQGSTTGNGLTARFVTDLVATDFDVRNHGGNGIECLSKLVNGSFYGCYIWTMTNCRIQGNKLNGILAKSLNTTMATINLYQCYLFFNGETGIKWSGTGLTINGGFIESNKYGVHLDMVDSIKSTFMTNIKNVDFENNKYEQIRITTQTLNGNVRTVDTLIIDGCNFVNTPPTNDGTRIVTAHIGIDSNTDASNSVSNIKIGVNKYFSNDVWFAFDGANKCSSSCELKYPSSLISSSEKIFKSYLNAKINGFPNSHSINGLINQKGIPFTLPDLSDELGHDGTQIVGWWELPIKQSGLINKIDCNFSSNSTTNYSVAFQVYQQQTDGTFTLKNNGATQTKTGGGDSTLSYSLGVNYGVDTAILMLKTTITKPTDGTIFKVKNVSVSGSW